MARRSRRSIYERCEDHREVPPAELWTHRDRRDHRRSEGLHKTLDSARELAARRRRRSDRVHLSGEQCRRAVPEIRWSLRLFKQGGNTAMEFAAGPEPSVITMLCILIVGLLVVMPVAAQSQFSKDGA